MRKITIGTYDTAANGWTLTGWQLSPAVQKTNFIDKPGGDGSWDFSTALTDGIPRYNDRDLTVTLECSEGDRLSRESKIKQMANTLDGMRLDIKLPDDSGHFITGRVHVAREFNNLAHAAVTITAKCEPWKYANTEKSQSVTASTTKKTLSLSNDGRRAVVPTLKVSGSNASVVLAFGAASLSLSAGTHKWPDLVLTPGTHSLTYSGTGTLVVTYREAVLE